MKSFLDFEEKNVEKAVQKACADLKVKRDKLKYDIISHGSSGIFGLVGAKKALIRVFVPDLKNGIPATINGSGSADQGPHADISQSEKDTVSALVDEAFGEVKPPEVSSPVKPKKNKKPVKAERTEPNKKPVSQKKEKPAKVESEGRAEKKEKKLKTESVKAPSIAIEAATDIENVTDSDFDSDAETEALQPVDNAAAIALAQELGREIFKAMSIDAEMSVNSESDQAWINVKVEEPGILIGKRGQTLEAIQYLVDKIVNKQCGKGSRIIFDVQGYVESRKTELKDLASRLASKAVKTGKPSTMTRMNAHDRRIVHVTLKRNRSVRTQSVGDGYYRKLIIFPKKKSQKKPDKAKP